MPTDDYKYSIELTLEFLFQDLLLRADIYFSGGLNDNCSRHYLGGFLYQFTF